MAAQSSVVKIFSAAEIRQRVRSIARKVSADMPTDLLVVGLLKGSYIFMADLTRELSAAGCSPEIDFMGISSYGQGTTRGKIKTYSEVQESVTGRSVLLVDDIFESGHSLRYAAELLQKQGAKHVKTCVLLEKKGKRQAEISPDYIGFTVPDKFVVGYGMDYANRYRELPYIGTLG